MNRRVTRRGAMVAGLSAAAGWAGCSRKEGDGGAAPVPKGDDNKWAVGNTVLPKKPDPAAKIVPPRDMKGPDGALAEVDGALRGASWEVKAEKDTRVEVMETGLVAWVEKDLLVPLADAVEFYTQALKDSDAWAFNFRGWAYYLLGKPEEAVKDLGEFLKRHENDAFPIYRYIGLSNRGLVLAEHGKFEDALKDLDEAIRLGHFPARLNRGWAYELKGDHKRAVADYAAVLAQSPGYTPGLNNLAWLRATCPEAALRDGKEAVKLARQACELSADREGTFRDTLAAAHAEAGDFVAAVKAQEKALEDVGFAKKYGDDAQKRLQLYKDMKPFRSAPPK